MSTERYDWAAMRADIESGAIKSFAELSAKYGATEQAIRNRRKADEKAGNPWPLPKIARAQETNVILLSQRRGQGTSPKPGMGQSHPKSEAEVDEAPLAVESENVDPLLEQKMLGVVAQRAVRRAFRRYMRGAITPGMHQSEADVVNALVSAGKNAVLINREIAGKGKGDPSGEQDEVDNTLEVVQRRVEPRIVDVDSAGRAVNEG